MVESPDNAEDEYVIKARRALLTFEVGQLPKYTEAYLSMRRLVPLDVAQLSVAMLTRKGIPSTIAKRLWEKKTLWLIVMHKEDIGKIHIADLRGKYQYSDLDIIEMR